MKIGIVGHESSKFSPSGEMQAKDFIINIAVDAQASMKKCKTGECLINVPILVSGRCPIATCYNCKKLQYAPSEASLGDPFVCPKCGNLDAIRKGGIDIWAEQIWDLQGWSSFKEIMIPRQNEWNGSYGFKARNLDIAAVSDVIHVIAATSYPDTYTGMRFETCYHCEAMPKEWKGNAEKHLKSGACYTAIRAFQQGKSVFYHFV